MPIWAEPGRTGGYCLDKARTLPPVNLTPGEAVALAVALRQVDGTPFLADAVERRAPPGAQPTVKDGGDNPLSVFPAVFCRWGPRPEPRPLCG